MNKKIQINNSEELFKAMQNLIDKKIDYIWAKDIKCSVIEHKRFKEVLKALLITKELLKIRIDISNIGNKFFLEIKRK